MWQDVRLLNATANTLFGLLVLAIIGSGMWWVMHRPMFALREVRLEGPEGTALKHVSPSTVRATALPPGVTSLKAGQKVEFGVVEGRKGEQALSLHVLEAPPSLSKAQRKAPEQMTVIVEDLIKMLDAIGNGYRRGRHPDPKSGGKVASVLRAVADELEL